LDVRSLCGGHRAGSLQLLSLIWKQLGLDWNWNTHVEIRGAR
jgi:hypothetical protein